MHAAATAAKSFQSCPTLCDPRDGSPPGSPVPGILQARTPEWVAISFSNAWKWKVKVKSFSRVWLLATPWTAAHQAPPTMGFSRQEYWRRVPLPSPLLDAYYLIKIVLISHTKLMFKILQARLHRYMNGELPDVQAGFRKGRGTGYQIANIWWIIENAREFQKIICFSFIDYNKVFDYVDHSNSGKLSKTWEYQSTLPASWETCMQVKNHQLEQDIE